MNGLKIMLLCFAVTVGVAEQTPAAAAAGVQSDFGLEVWEFSTTSGTTADWDVSGGLMWPVLSKDGNYIDRPFYDKYHRSEGGTSYLMFRSVDNELVRPNADCTPIDGYDPERQIVQYYEGSNVYVIDFKGDLTVDKRGAFYPEDSQERGLYVVVPNVRAAQDDKGNPSYRQVPMILRSGVRFGVHNLGAPSDIYKYLKYGRGMRLNEQPREIGHGSWECWNGIPLANIPNPTVAENIENAGDHNSDHNRIDGYTISVRNEDGEVTKTLDYMTVSEDVDGTFYNKLGDNRLVSEYNMYIDRIILEVVNEGVYSGDHPERVYLRFEGRYDLDGVAANMVTYSYSTDGMKPKDEETNVDHNYVGTSPNIYMGNTIRFFDRGFTRFYACFNASYHGSNYMEELADAVRFHDDLDRFNLMDYTEGYAAESEYQVLDRSGDKVNYIGYENYYGGFRAEDNGRDLNLGMNTYPADFKIKYKSINYKDADYRHADNGEGSHFMAMEINDITTQDDGYSYVGRYLIYSMNAPSDIRDNGGNGAGSDSGSRYGNATDMVIQGRRMCLMVDALDNSANHPATVKAITTYHFPYAEPNNVPAYTIETVLPPHKSLKFNALLNISDPRYDKDDYPDRPGYVVHADLSGSEYAHGKVWKPVTGETDSYYPVTRWEISAWRDDPPGDECFVRSSNYNFAELDKTNKYDSEELGLIIYDEPDPDPGEVFYGRKINYRALMIYTLGNVNGLIDDNGLQHSIVISEKALEQYVKSDAVGVAGSPNAYAVEYVDGEPGTGKTLDNENVPIAGFTLSPKVHVPADFNAGRISVSLYQTTSVYDTYAEFDHDQTITGTENVAVAVGAAEYYNMQGVRVRNPMPGAVYIVRRSTVVTKELIR